MRIHIDKTVATPSAVFRQGERCTVSDKTGRELIDGGAATHISIWLRNLAAEEGYDIVKAKKPNKSKLAKLMDF